MLTHLEIRRNKISGISKSNEGRMKVLAALASGLRKFAKIKIALKGISKMALTELERQKDSISWEPISERADFITTLSYKRGSTQFEDGAEEITGIVELQGTTSPRIQSCIFST